MTCGTENDGDSMKNPDFAPTMTRRRFLRLASAGLALPTLIPARLLGASAPSQRVNLGVLGCGNMGTSNLRAFLQQKDCQVLAACDVDKQHLSHAIGIVNRNYSSSDCKGYHDFRELLGRDDIDAARRANCSPARSAHLGNWAEVGRIRASPRSNNACSARVKPLSRLDF